MAIPSGSLNRQARSGLAFAKLCTRYVGLAMTSRGVESCAQLLKTVLETPLMSSWTTPSDGRRPQYYTTDRPTPFSVMRESRWRSGRNYRGALLTAPAFIIKCSNGQCALTSLNRPPKSLSSSYRDMLSTERDTYLIRPIRQVNLSEAVVRSLANVSRGPLD